MLEYHRFDPGPCGFPRPRVPVLPPLTPQQLTWRASGPQRAVRHYARGRYALHAAYALAGVGPHGGLIAPAYHCRTMLDPALRLEAEVALYALTPALEPDLDALRRQIAALPKPPRALLFTHYFGVPRDATAVAALCGEWGMVLVEDCSHALVPDTEAASTVGRRGHYAVSSPYKFYPCPDGGLLWANGGAALPDARPASPGSRAEIRAIAQVLRQLRQRHFAPDPAALAGEIEALAPRFGTLGRDWVARDETVSADYAPADENRASTAASRWVQRHCDVDLVVRQRRLRYAQWSDAVAPLAGCRALFASLPAGATPYMFPLLLDRPGEHFQPLKHLGLPIWRWDDMAVSDCAVSRQYRQGVFHLPCHQALTDADMAWMTAAVATVVGRR